MRAQLVHANCIRVFSVQIFCLFPPFFILSGFTFFVVLAGLLGTTTAYFRLCTLEFHRSILEHNVTGAHTHAHFCLQLFLLVLRIRTDSLLERDGSMIRVFFYIVIAIMALFLSLAGWVGVELSSGKPFKYPIWLRVLRTISDVFFTGVLFIPVRVWVVCVVFTRIGVIVRFFAKIMVV